MGFSGKIGLIIEVSTPLGTVPSPIWEILDPPLLTLNFSENFSSFYYFDFGLMTLIIKLDLDKVKMCLHTQNKNAFQ